MDELVTLSAQRVEFDHQLLAPLVDGLQPALEVGSVDEASLEDIHQPAAFVVGAVQSSAELRELLRQQLIVESGRARGQGVLAADQDLWPQQGLSNLLEHEVVEAVGTNVGCSAALVLPSCPQGVSVRARVVAEDVDGRPVAHASADYSAVPTADQAPEQPVAGISPAAAELPVHVAHLLSGVEDLSGNDGGNRYRYPLFGWSQPLAGRPLLTDTCWQPLLSIAVQGSHVDRVVQYACDGAVTPDQLAGRRGYAGLVQTPADLAHRVIAGHVVVIDATDDCRLGLEDLEVGRYAGSPGDAAIAVGHLPAHRLARSSSKESTSAVALGYLGPFVFGDDPLHLRQQTDLRVAVQSGSVGEQHWHLVAFELFQDQVLVRVGPGQSIRRQAEHAFDEALLGGITQGVQAGTVQMSARVAVVLVLSHDLVALACCPLPQHLQLRADGATSFLYIGGNAGVESEPHPSLPNQASRPGTKSASKTGSLQCGHSPPRPTRSQKMLQSGQRCSPTYWAPQPLQR